ncbi:hypothetical protein GCM10020254_81210 [Streptomyces goshikiensis]
MSERGLIARRPSTEDGRGTMAILTARGAQLLRDTASEHFGRLEAMVSGLSVEERAVFLDLLARVVRGSAAPGRRLTRLSARLAPPSGQGPFTR